MISSLELARLCGVSQGTVDRALHNRSGISARTREKVLRAAEEHGYRPHPGALEILGKTSSTVACVIPSINGVFFMDLLETIRAGIRGLGRRFVIVPVADGAEMLEALRDFSARRCPVAVVVPPEDDMPLPADVTRHTRVVSLLSPCRGESTRFVSPDEERTGRDAVRYLASMGHRCILHLTYSRRAHAIAARERGYTQAMEERGLRPVTRVEKKVSCLAELVAREKATALFCHNDWLALTAVRKLAAAGLRVPEDVSVLGVDNSPTFVSLYPDLTTLEYPGEWIRDQVVRVVTGKEPLKRKPGFRLVQRATVAKRGGG